MKTTVLIPLHHGARWKESLCEQLEELRGVARIIVSDPIGGDTTLDDVRASVDHPSIEWVGVRSLSPGWVAHANDLQSRASTEFVMWLPQDDRITREWITQAEEHLDRDSDAIAACGPIEPLSRDSQGRGVHVDVPSFVTVCETVDRVATAVDRLIIGQSSELGVLFRSVVRRADVPPLPPGVVGDDWADLLWALRLLSRGSVVPIAASYGKRWHDHNTHGGWRDHAAERPDLVRSAVSSALDRLSAETRSEVLTRAWIADIQRHREEFKHREDHWRTVHSALWRDVESSASWRLTAPARRSASALRRLFSKVGRTDSRIDRPGSAQ